MASDCLNCGDARRKSRGESITGSDISARKHETGGPYARRSSLSQCKSRLWRKRIVALLFPILVLVALEILFRMFGLYEEPGAEKCHVEFESGTVFFPEWDRDISYPKPSDVNRIFVLGGSSAMGFGVDRPFFDLLREKLNHQKLESRWEVINGAVGAFGSHSRASDSRTCLRVRARSDRNLHGPQ